MLIDDDDEHKGRRGRRHVLPGSARRPLVLLACLGVVAALASLIWWWIEPQPPNIGRFDCVIIPGGGLGETHEPAAWVAARLDAALMHDSQTDFYLVLSRGTTHKPPPLEAGFPVDEAAASARYLVARGVAPSRVLLESWSLDTIGNAVFARLMHADLRNWRRLHVITSAFHLPRTEAIFNWVFTLPDAAGRQRRPSAKITYELVPDGDMDAHQSAARRQKELEALEKLQQGTLATVTDLAMLHNFIFVGHGAYRAMSAEDEDARDRERAKGALASTY